MNFLLALLLTLFVGTPTLTVGTSTPYTITVTNLPPHSVMACTVFTSVDELNSDGTPYAPKHCWFLGPDLTSYDDDWNFIPTGHEYDVSAEISSMPDEHGDVNDITTNVVRHVKH